MDRVPDELLVAESLAGDRQSFEVLVERYQTLVCSIAYSITGDFSRSEDVGQESLVEAWKQLDRLSDRSKFKSWLCSITRNIAHNANRKLAKMQPRECSDAFQDPATSAEDRAMRDEEATLVWEALEGLPDQYREPLVLFYRHDQSIAEVADSLDLSNDVVKQRLSRGRNMLRAEVTSMVQRALRRSVPSRAFTVAVLAAIPAIGSKTAAAATTATATTVATAAKQTATAGAVKSAGMLGPVLGPLAGIAGGFFGAWCSWTRARYQSERVLIVRTTLIYFVGAAIFSMPYVAMRMGWQPWNVYGPRNYALMNVSWIGIGMGANFLWMFLVFRAYGKLVKREDQNETEKLPDSTLQSWLNQYEGRRWTSRLEWLGAPLVDIAFTSPGSPASGSTSRVVARGWIAIGDFAVGRLIALGNFAAAPIAFGTLSVGIVSGGVFSVGVVSLGVFSTGVLAVGILGAGIFVLGVMAVGYLAVGVVAIAWQGARGVVAIAYHFAVGQQAWATHQGDQAAQEFVSNSRFLETGYAVLVGSAQWVRFPMSIALMATVLGLMLVFIRLAYRRKVPNDSL